MAAAGRAEILAGSETIGWVETFILCRSRTLTLRFQSLPLRFVASLLRLSQKDLPIVEPPTYPGISIDLAGVDESVTADSWFSAFEVCWWQLLCDIRLFDVYRDPRVGEGKKYGLHVSIRTTERLLGKVEKTHTKLCGEGPSFYRRRNSRISG